MKTRMPAKEGPRKVLEVQWNAIHTTNRPHRLRDRFFACFEGLELLAGVVEVLALVVTMIVSIF